VPESGELRAEEEGWGGGEAHAESMGAVLSSLARAALQPREHSARADGFPVFEVGADAPPLTPDMVRDALEDV